MKPIIVISLSKNQSTDIKDDPTIEGEFDSIKKAKDWIREDSVAVADNMLESGRHEQWGSTHIICRVIDIVTPVPTVKISVSLKSVARI